MRAEVGAFRRPITIGLVVAFTAAAVALVLFATEPRGAGLTIDSTTYLLAADSYGRDVSEVGAVLNGVFPPGYSAAIAAVDVVVDDLGRAAIAVNVLSLALVLALLAHSVWVSGERGDDGAPTVRQAAATVATVAIVALSTQMLRWTGAAMSELFSLVFVFAAIAMAARYARTGRTATWVLVGVVGGAAALVRLVALGSMLGVALGVCLVLVDRSLRARLVAGSTVAAAGVATAVLGAPLLAGSNDSRRTIAWHPITAAEVREGLDTVASYVLPSSLSGGLARVLAAVAVALFVLFVLAVVRRAVAGEPAVPPVCVLATTVAVAHVATVLGSMFLVDDLTPLDTRILLPVVPLVALAMGSAIAASVPVVSPRVVLAVALVVAVGQTGRVGEWLDGMRSEGMGYAHTLFDGSETLAAVRSLPADAEVWTNDVSLLYLRADRRAAQLPSDTDNYSARATEDYDEMIAALGERLDEGAVIVYADYFDFTTLPDVDELQGSIGPLDVERLSDGAIVRRRRGA